MSPSLFRSLPIVQIFTGSIAYDAITVVVIAAIVACVVVGLRRFGVSFPDWVVAIFWICVAAVVIVFAIKFLAGLR